MIYPYKSGFRLVSPFGHRTDPITGERGAWHGGIDLVGDDILILSVSSGTVAASQIVTDPNNLTSEWGNYVAVLNDDGTICYYCHLSQRHVFYGQRVVPGEVIGVEGSTGRSTGSHLHFEVRFNGEQVNAAEYLGIPNSEAYHAASIGCTENWWGEALEWAQKNGIIYGDENGDLMLDEPCTRKQMIVFLHRLHNLMGGE